MTLTILTDRADLSIRRLTLAPGEASAWHSDPCHRFTVVITGQRLVIEFRDGAAPVEVAVHPGLTGWDEPEERVHRAVNAGTGPYEEVVTFYRESPGQDPQPQWDGEAG